MIMRRALLLFAVIFITGTVLNVSAGGQKGGTQDSTGDAVQIEFWTNQSAEERLNTYRAMADSFVESNPDVAVEVVPYGEEVEFVQKWTTAQMADNLPEAVEAEMWSALQIMYDGSGNPEVATNVIEALGEDDFYEYPLEFVTYNGEYHGVPNSVFANAVFYRTDIFEEHGVPVPGETVTYDELLSAARQLHNPEQRQYGITLMTAREIYVQNLNFLANAIGVQIFDDSGNVAVNSSQRSQWQDLLTSYRDLAQYTQPGPQTGDDVYSNFTSGATAMSIVATFLPAYIEGSDPAIQEVTDVSWIINKEQDGSYFLGVAYIPIAGMNDAEARATEGWLEHIMTGEERISYLNLVPGGFNAVRRSVANSDAYLGHPTREKWGADFFLNMLEASSAAQHWGKLPSGRVVPEVGEAISSLVIQEEVFAIAEEGKSVDQAIVDIDRRLKEELGQ